MTGKLFPKLVMAGALASAPLMPAALHAQTAAASSDITTLTVHEAWVQSGRNEDKFFDIVKQLTAISSQKRGITLPDTEATGKRIGSMIKTSGRRDPDQLLYAIVDNAVKQIGGTGAAAK